MGYLHSTEALPLFSVTVWSNKNEDKRHSFERFNFLPSNYETPANGCWQKYLMVFGIYTNMLPF